MMVFVDAIKKYDDKQTALDKAIDDIQKDVSVFYHVSLQFNNNYNLLISVLQVFQH